MRRATLLLLTVFGACIPVGEGPEQAPVAAVVHGDSVTLSMPLNARSVGIELVSDLSLSTLTLPTDIAELPGSGFAVVDRLDHTITVFDRDGVRIRSFGRAGEGPGEFEEPYALAGFDSLLVVWDKSRHLTMLTPEGEVVGTHELADSDTRAIWQRSPITQWEEPLQLSRENVAQRIGDLPGVGFGFQLQVDERFDDDFLETGTPRRFPNHLVRFGPDGHPLDTLASMPGQELTLQFPGNELLYARAQERLFATRMLWAAGTDWFAVAHGRDSAVDLHFTSSARRIRVRWPRDDRPIGESDVAAYREWESEAYHRTHSTDAGSSFAQVPLDRLFEDLVGAADRPQITSLFGSGSCLVLAGFNPTDSPHASSRSLLVLDVTRLSSPVTVRLPADAHLLRSFQGDAIFAIRIGEDGTRSVERYGLPPEACAQR